MTLSTLLLSLTLLAWSMIQLGWLVFDLKVVAVLALITGILLILESLGLFSYRTPVINRRAE